MRSLLAATMLMVLGVIFTHAPALAVDAAQSDVTSDIEGEAPPPAAASSRPFWFWEVLFSGGLLGCFVGIALVGMSVAAVALTIDGALLMRRHVLIPPGLAEEVRGHLAAGHAAEASQRCQTRPSLLATILESGIAEIDVGWPAVEKRMEDTLAAQAARLARKIDYLALIAQLAPLTGLLGTIVGIITTFSAISHDGKASQVAGGLSQAIVSTEFALLIAIPAWAATVFLRSRAERLIAETAEIADSAMTPVKRSLVARAAAVPPPPPQAGGR